MSGWRKRQIHDSQMRGVQDPESYLQEPDGSHEGHWPQEAMYVLGVPPSPPTWQSLLQPKSIVDVLCGGTGRREDRSAGLDCREGMAGDRSSEGQTK